MRIAVNPFSLETLIGLEETELEQLVTHGSIEALVAMSDGKGLGVPQEARRVAISVIRTVRGPDEKA